MPQPVVEVEDPEVQGAQLPAEVLRLGTGDLQRVLGTVNDRHRRVYNALADEYEKKSPAHITTTQDRVNHVSEYVAPGSKILDVGCGVGLALLMLSRHEKGFNATGVDISPRMAELALQRSPHTPVIVGDFLAVDFHTKYDAIWEQALLHLFPSIAEDYIFEHFHNLLNPGGILSLSTTVSEVSREGWEAKRDYGAAPMRYRRSFTEAELRDALAKHRFGLVDRWMTRDPFGKNWFTVVCEKQRVGAGE
jgi:SAM-dependent methyltransferase